MILKTDNNVQPRYPPETGQDITRYIKFWFDLVQTLKRIQGELGQSKKMNVFWIFPYFMENKLKVIMSFQTKMFICKGYKKILVKTWDFHHVCNLYTTEINVILKKYKLLPLLCQ